MSNSIMTPNLTAPYFIELLTRDKSLKARHRFAQLPITIGRGYDNDLILDDPYIAPHHAVIEMTASGVVHMRDLNSENGIVSQGKRQYTLPIDERAIRLGHTNIRIRHAGSAVAKTLTDKASHAWEGWPPAITGLLMLAASAFGSAWLSASEKFSPLSAISIISMLVMMAIIWSGGWALATRLVSGGSSRFGRHLFIAASAAILIDCWSIISVTVAYAFSLDFLSRYSSHMVIAIAAGMVFFHLMTMNSQHPKRFIVICSVLALLGSGFTLMTNYQRNGQLADSLYMTELLPPVLRLSGDASVDTFIDNAKALKPKLDKAREKPANLKKGLLGN